MAGKRTITGIDIGSHSVRVVIAEYTPGEGLPRIIGTGKSESRGLRRGYIIAVTDAVRSIRAAIAEAEEEAGQRVRGVYLSLGGVGLESAVTTGSAVVTRADNVITHADQDRALRAAENALPNPDNKKVLLAVPIEHRIDGKRVYGRPVGMHGLKLDVTALVVTTLEQHLADLIMAVEEAGLEVDDVQAAPIAASFVALTKEQKMAGCILANIGAETLSIVVYEEGIPVSLEVFPVGSANITNDIALGLRIPLEEAELIKMGKSGTAHAYPKKKLADIIEARLEDMFALITAHLKKIGKNELLPAGIILTGGGSGIHTLEDFAAAATRLHARVPGAKQVSQLALTPRIGVNDTSWFVAYGLTIMGASQKSEGGLSSPSTRHNLVDTIRRAVKQLLP